MVHKDDSQLIKIRYNPNTDCVMNIMLNLIKPPPQEENSNPTTSNSSDSLVYHK